MINKKLDLEAAGAIANKYQQENPLIDNDDILNINKIYYSMESAFHKINEYEAIAIDEIITDLYQTSLNNNSDYKYIMIHLGVDKDNNCYKVELYNDESGVDDIISIDETILDIDFLAKLYEKAYELYLMYTA